MLEGRVAGKDCQIVVDTGASNTIVRTDLIQKLKSISPSRKFVITTANGESIDVRGEVMVQIEIGSMSIPHKVFVAEITDPIILGMDFLDAHKAVLDFDQRLIKIDNEELVLRRNKDERGWVRRAALTDDLVIPARTEVVAGIELEEGSRGKVGVLDPVFVSDNGSILGRTLITAMSQRIPARLMNTKDYEHLLRKGTIVGQCEEAQVIKREGGKRPNED